MATLQNLTTLVSELRIALERQQYGAANNLLSNTKRALLQFNALYPTPTTPAEVLPLAREALELGALASIRQQDADGFRRYYQQLQPFYDLEQQREEERETGGVVAGLRNRAVAPGGGSNNNNRSMITGLYMLLLLSVGDIAGFHTVLERLVVEASLKGRKVEDDQYIRYPVDLERSLMEGSYDKVWTETKSERVPTGEFGMFSEILVGTIRNEIADCSEKAYPSLPISNAKNLLFLDSDGAVIEFARSRGWILRDGRIYFPEADESQEEAVEGQAPTGKKFSSETTGAIENAIGYARELETIV